MTGELKKVTNQKDLANQKLGYLYETYHGFVKYFSKNMFQGMTREAFEDKFWARIQKMVNDGKYEYVKDEKSYLNGIMKKVSYELLREKGKQLKTVDISLYSDSLSSFVQALYPHHH